MAWDAQAVVVAIKFVGRSARPSNLMAVGTSGVTRPIKLTSGWRGRDPRRWGYSVAMASRTLSLEAFQAGRIDASTPRAAPKITTVTMPPTGTS